MADLKDIFRDAPVGHLRYGVVGWPLAHTLSPVMHEAAIRHLGLPAVYRAMPVSPEEWGAFLELALQEGFLEGFNITLPYKERLFGGDDVLSNFGASEYGRACGAVNTVVRRQGRGFADNTDGAGFLSDLEEKGVPLQNQDVVLFGAGGAARAILFAFQLLAFKAPKSVTIVNRTPERVEKLVSDLESLPGQTRFKVFRVRHDEVQWALASASLAINATSLGLKAGDPPPADLSGFHPGMTFYDLIYHRETEMMRSARLLGCRVLGGLGMLVQQGANAFQIWFNRSAPLAVMRRAAEEELKKRTEQ